MKAVKILEGWAKRYFSLHHDLFRDEDTIYFLLWSILLLTLNLHYDPTVQLKNIEASQKISQDEWTQYYLEAFLVDKSLLTRVYDNVSAGNSSMFGDLSGIRSFVGKKQASGWLTKQGGKRKTWKKRWFMLHPDRLCYYKGVNVRNRKSDYH